MPFEPPTKIEDSTVPSTSPTPAVILQAQYAALQNDLQQARELAADFQRQLAGKSNDYADLKQAAEVASSEVARLKADVLELRQERLQLANEVARIAGLEFRLKRTAEERDNLKVEVEGLRAVVVSGQRNEVNPSPAVQFPAPGSHGPMSGNERIYAKRLLSQLAGSLEELQSLVDPDPARKTPPAKPAGGEIISVSFVG